MAKRQYSEADKASALALLQANGGNIKRTANELDMPMTTLRQWRNGEHVNADTTQKRDEKRRSLADVFEDIAYAYAEQAMTEAQGTRGKDAVIAAATAVDKLRLLKGESTDISEVRGSDAREQLADRIRRLTRPAERDSGPN